MNDEHRCRRMRGRAGALERRAEVTGDAGRAPEGDGNDADTATPGAVHRAALVAVKAVHTLIFFSMSWAVLYTLYSGLTNRISRKTGVAISAVLGEAIVFASNGWRCPLTKVAEQLGAANGTVGDIFLPKWFARRIPQVSSTLMGVGMLAMLWHRVHVRSWIARDIDVSEANRPGAGAHWQSDAAGGVLFT